MGTSWRRCFLILLLISAQTDETWIVTSVWPAPPLADDDEYLPSNQRDWQERPDARQISTLARPRSPIDDVSLVQTNARCPSKFTDQLGSLSLYVFMSLQC
jgi:hypothetical protein